MTRYFLLPLIALALAAAACTDRGPQLIDDDDQAGDSSPTPEVSPTPEPTPTPYWTPPPSSPTPDPGHYVSKTAELYGVWERDFTNSSGTTGHQTYYFYQDMTWTFTNVIPSDPTQNNTWHAHPWDVTENDRAKGIIALGNVYEEGTTPVPGNVWLFNNCWISSTPAQLLCDEMKGVPYVLTGPVDH